MMRRTERGITLIALIITIAVMLILAVVSIDLVVGDGLFDSAGDAVGKTNAKVNQQQTRVDELMGKVGEIEEGQKPKAIAGRKAETTMKYNDGNKTAVIPGGFTVSGVPSESTIDGGLVIYLINDKSDAEIAAINWNDGTTVANLQTTYDQFVWIPIDNINDMYICQAKDGSNGNCNITVEGGNAKCATHNSTAMAGRLYATDTGENFNSTLTNQTYTAGSGLREPDVVTDAECADGNSSHLSQLTNILGEGYDTTNNFKQRLQEEYNEIVKSVYLNKGFYVGRYETSEMVDSDTNATIKVVAGTTNGIRTVTWYRMYAQAKKYVANKSLTTVGSTMIQGAAYDQVMKFVNTENYNVTTTGYALHNRNYEDGPGQTGGLDYADKTQYKDVTKNIYDLEGNVSAWTTETNNSTTRVYRGGDYDGSYSASDRYRRHSGQQSQLHRYD